MRFRDAVLDELTMPQMAAQPVAQAPLPPPHMFTPAPLQLPTPPPQSGGGEGGGSGGLISALVPLALGASTGGAGGAGGGLLAGLLGGGASAAGASYLGDTNYALGRRGFSLIGQPLGSTGMVPR